MTNKEKARDYAYARQKNLHLSQRDTNLIQLAYLHGLEDGLTEYKLVPVKRKEWEDCVNDESGKYDFAFGNVFEVKTGNPVILCIEDGDELLRYRVIKETNK